MHLVEKIERALVAAKAREDELSHAVDASRAKVSVAEDQASITSACMLSLEEEHEKKVVPIEEEIRAEAQACSHQDKAGKVKEFEDRIKKLGHLQ